MQEVSMMWMNEHKRVWRVAVLGLLLVAILGPWAFARIMVRFLPRFRD